MNTDEHRWDRLHAILFSFSRLSSVFICVYLWFNLTGCTQTRVEKFTLDGQPAYKLTDGKVEAIVEPAKRRVMSFRRVNGPNLFHVNPDAKPGKPGEQVGYGGTFAWLWPQEKWNGGKADWPPPGDVTGVGASAIETGNGVTMWLEPFRMDGRLQSIVSTFELEKPGRLRLAISSYDRPWKSLPGFGVWSVTQVVPPDAIFARLARDGLYGATALAPFSASQLLNPRIVDGRVFQVGRGGDSARKAGFDADRLAAWYESTGTLLLLEMDIDGPGTFRHGERAQVYTDANLVELEFTAPITEPGNPAATLIVRYSIHDAPTREDAVRIVAGK
jgi:hypothetical protein